MALTPWRTAAEPQREVYEGRYQQAEFAADLGQVLAGRAEAEYQEGASFYARTYLTEGMRRLLVQVLERTAGSGGEPVIQLKTAFGGGKTHSLLALYHLFTGRDATSWRGVPEILAEAGIDALPRARVAALVGTDLDPNIRRPDAAGHGVEVGTLWGELGAQLGDAEGYAIVAAADRSGAAPGAATLLQLFERFGPCVILVDELVAYVRNLAGKEGLPGGTTDSNLTFVQVLTEATRKSRSSCLLAAIPESRIETATPAGQAALERIEHIFGRMEAVWQPVREEESFEIVRRRLFSERIDEKARDATCRAFARLYAEGSDFPAETREGRYLERLKGAYPIHPEVFDRLYRDWSTIEEFQRTRGVLRLMAGVIHGLWAANDRSPLILPGTLPLGQTRVRNELTKYIGDAWNGVVDSDVDGDSSAPARLDRANPRFGQVQAAQRLTRTIFLGTAPHGKGGGARGIEEVRVRLGAVMPGESISTVNDALAQLQRQLTYLYAGNGRYWFDTHPNLLQTARDRADRYEREDVVLPHLAERLGALTRTRGDFSAVHAAAESADLPDEARVRLVLLPTTATHHPKKEPSPARARATELLEWRGSSPRLLRNMLIFVAPDAEHEASLELEARRYLAWKSIVDDADTLNLDRAQIRQATAARDTAERTVELRLKETYSWLVAPTQAPGGPIELEFSRLPGSEPPAVRASAALRASENLITRWSPLNLRHELDRVLWREREGEAGTIRHVLLKKVWSDLASYPYLPRLLDQRVLEETVREGVRSRDFFGYATGVRHDGSYLGLVFGAPATAIYFDDASVLVKPEAANAQQEAEAYPPAGAVVGGRAAIAEAGTAAGTGAAGDAAVEIVETGRRAPKRFHGSVEISHLRAGMEAGKIAEEVVSHLSALLDAEVELTLDIEATSESGFPEKVVRTVTENANTLKFKYHGFEDE